MAKKFVEKDYNIIKKLLDNRLSKKEVMDITGWKDTTVRNVEMADTWQNYCAEKKERYKRNKQSKKVIEDITPKQNNDDKVIRTVQNVADAINRLADILENDTPITKEAREFKLFGKRG